MSVLVLPLFHYFFNCWICCDNSRSQKLLLFVIKILNCIYFFLYGKFCQLLARLWVLSVPYCRRLCYSHIKLFKTLAFLTNVIYVTAQISMVLCKPTVKTVFQIFCKNVSFALQQTFFKIKFTNFHIYKTPRYKLQS